VPHLRARRRRLRRFAHCALAAASACLAVPLLAAGAWADAGSLTTDANGSPLVSAVRLSPGHVLERCVVITTPTAYTSADLGMYATAGGGLADHLNVTVETGSGGGFADCTGFNGRLVYVGTLTGLANGFDATRPVRVGHYSDSVSAVTLRLRFSVQDDNAAQGQTTTAAFWWLPIAPAPVPVPVPVPTVTAPDPSTAATTSPDAAPTTTPDPTTTPAAPRTTAPAGNRTSSAVPPGTPTTTTLLMTKEPDGGLRTPLPPRAVHTTPAPSASPLGPPVGLPLTDNGATPAAVPPGQTGGGGDDPPAGILGSLTSNLADGVANAAHNVSTAAAPALQGAAVTSLMILPLVLVFLLVQRVFDRRDPKLALAPSYGDPFLGFVERHRLHDRPTDQQGEAP
jgi:hypothetical protein